MTYYYQQAYTQGVDSLGGMEAEQVDYLMPIYDPNENMGWDAQAPAYMAGGEDLVMYGSSGGSSCNDGPSPGYYVYGGTSPDTVNPTLIQYGCDYDVYGSPTSPHGTPRKQHHSRHSSSVPICCDQCNATFKRRADLKRHIDHIHDPSNLAPIYCDYSKCPRHVDPFRRKDHFRDHLREYHREDMEPRGAQFGEDWYNNRNLSMGWWRCVKCLNRVPIEQSGFNCPSCGGSAGKKRQEARGRR